MYKRLEAHVWSILRSMLLIKWNDKICCVSLLRVGTEVVLWKMLYVVTWSYISSSPQFKDLVINYLCGFVLVWEANITALEQCDVRMLLLI